MDEPAIITVCQGPPRCDLRDDEAVAAQMEGCPWCSRVYLYEDGREETVQPGTS